MGSHGDTVGAKPNVRCHAPLSVKGGCNVLVSVRASLLVRYLELRGVRYSGVLFILVNVGGWASAKARCPLDGGVCY